MYSYVVLFFVLNVCVYFSCVYFCCAVDILSYENKKTRKQENKKTRKQENKKTRNQKKQISI